tara:strand:- start:49 stop:255 length:207 start_codon:yes stop_codon:yes gene_type:complete
MVEFKHDFPLSGTESGFIVEQFFDLWPRLPATARHIVPKVFRQILEKGRLKAWSISDLIKPTSKVVVW